MWELQNQQRIPLRGVNWKVVRPRPIDIFQDHQSKELLAKAQAFDELKKSSQQDIAELRELFETDALLLLRNKNQKKRRRWE